MSVEPVMPSNHLILCRLLLLLPSIFPSIKVSSCESTLCIMWSKYWTSASASVLPMTIQCWFPLGLTDLISWQSKGFSRVFSSTTFASISSLVPNLLCAPTLTSIHNYWKNHGWLYGSMFVMVFLPRIKCLVISWLQSLSAVILEPKKIKSVTASTFPLLFAMELSGITQWVLAL